MHDSRPRYHRNTQASLWQVYRRGTERHVKILFKALTNIPLLQRILIANLIIITLGAVFGTLLTAEIAEAGGFNQVTFAIIITSAALLSGSISFVMLKVAFRPFENLQRVLAKIHAGNTRARVSLDKISDPDIRHFTIALNQMLKRLDENAKVIQEDQHKLQVMTARVITAQENERKRIARELHDEASQSLTAMIMGLEGARQQAGEEALKTKLEGLKGLASDTLEELRKMALDLRPTMLDDLGLIPAVRWLSRNAAERGKFELKLELDGCNDATRLAPELETCLFRITQESLTNIIKHARATQVNIQLQRQEDGGVKLAVIDNGVGFDRSKARHKAICGGHLGLFDIEERAMLVNGEAQITTGPGGTNITVTVPAEGCAIIHPVGQSACPTAFLRHK